MVSIMSVSDQIISVIDALCAKFGVAIDWTSNNVMPILGELASKYIDWEITTSTMWLVIGAIIFVLCMFFGIFFCFRDDAFFGVFLICAAIVAGMPMIITQILDIIKCIKFPELQIVEYIKELIMTSASQ